MKKSAHNRLFLLCGLLCVAMLISHPQAGGAQDPNPPIKIGVLMLNSYPQTMDQWSPTARYLTRQVPEERFVVLPLTHEQIRPAVQNGEIDFLLTNSAIYVWMEHLYHVNRIATLKEKRPTGVYTKYGGVIFCRKDREDIRSLTDLYGKSFMAVSETSLGGWLAVWRELKERGIDPSKAFKDLRFADTHDQVVFAVRDRRVDAGSVRTNMLEELAAAGKIELSDYYVFPRLPGTGPPTPYFCTTREYPNWPMAKVDPTPDELAEKVALALFQLPPESPAAQAAGYAGWTIPPSYQPVHECLKILGLGPYHVSFGDFLKRYGFWIFLALLAFGFLTLFFGFTLMLNRRIKDAHGRLKQEMDLHKTMDLELKSAKEVAETATRAKSEFLANMSHEIRTPMNGVIAAADLALSEEVPPKVGKYLKMIHTSAYSLLSIINDILDFSKIEAGKLELKERVFSLTESIDRVMELFVNKAAEKGIELLVDIDLDTPKILKGDPLRLQQILTNLVSNAVKFTDPGGVILLHVNEVSEPAQDPDVLTLYVYVKDTGMGIAPEYIDQLFMPFSQADTSSTRKYEGTGLGLSICKQLVTLMNGEIGVESEPGKGSTFYFKVRMRRVSDRPVSRLRMPPDIQGMNVLVVDDLADSRAIMRNILESLGCRVETLSSGQDALNRLEENFLRNTPVDLILMDWKMPVMDGIAVSRKIRQELKLTIPIIMMTAFGKEEQRIEAEKVGINGFLFKPIYPSTLFDAIMDGVGKEGLKTAGRRRKFTTRASLYRRHLKGVKILVAEDNPTNQQVAQAILEGAGVSVTIAGNGEEAVQAFKEAPFDAVLMDIQMPRMNGYEATRSIRKLPQGASIPIVAMTAHAMKGDEEKCLEAGMDGYVSKPVNQDRLFQTLRRLLGAAKQAEEAGSGDQGTDTGLHGERTLRPTFYEDDFSSGADPFINNGRHLPDTLPGIDIGRTLSRLNIESPTLMRIMFRFLADNQTTADAIRQAFSNNDMESLGRLAHSLRGSAANIGAAELSKAARAVEEVCSEDVSQKSEPPPLEDRIETLTSALNQVLTSIQSLQEPEWTEAATQGVPRSCPPLGALLTQLAEAIDKADPELVQKIMAHVRQQAAQCNLVQSLDIKTLEAQIERYDYDPALETIEKIRKSTQVEA